MTHTYDQLMANGRLGNQLWQIASTVGLAHAIGDDVKFQSDWEYRNVFNVPDDWFGNDSCPPIVDGGTNYFQEFHLFEPVQEQIWQAFQPRVSAIHELRDQGGPLSPSCALHVRRGDYLNYPDVFVNLLETNYYQRAMAYISKLDPSVVFYVFSDDIEWCEKYFMLGMSDSQVVYVKGAPPREIELADRVTQGAPTDWHDLVHMMYCDYHIISNSTFAWWGAWLASASMAIVYPSRWFGPAAKGPDGGPIPWRLMIPPHDGAWVKATC